MRQAAASRAADGLKPPAKTDVAEESWRLIVQAKANPQTGLEIVRPEYVAADAGIMLAQGGSLAAGHDSEVFGVDVVAFAYGNFQDGRGGPFGKGVLTLLVGAEEHRRVPLPAIGKGPTKHFSGRSGRNVRRAGRGRVAFDNQTTLGQPAGLLRLLKFKAIEKPGYFFDHEVLVAKIDVRDRATRPTHLEIPTEPQFKTIGKTVAQQHFGQAVGFGHSSIVDERVRRFENRSTGSGYGNRGSKRIAIGQQFAVLLRESGGGQERDRQQNP